MLPPRRCQECLLTQQGVERLLDILEVVGTVAGDREHDLRAQVHRMDAAYVHGFGTGQVEDHGDDADRDAEREEVFDEFLHSLNRVSP